MPAVLAKETAQRGCSSVGRALEWHSRGQEFNSLQLHQNFGSREIVSLFFNAFRWLRERSDRNSKPPAMPVEPKTLYIKNTFSIERSCSSSRPQSKRCFLWRKNKIWHIRNGCVSTILSSPRSIGENLSMGNTVKRLEEFYDSYAVTKGWRFWKGI